MMESSRPFPRVDDGNMSARAFLSLRRRADYEEIRINLQERALRAIFLVAGKVRSCIARKEDDAK